MQTRRASEDPSRLEQKFFYLLKVYTVGTHGEIIDISEPETDTAHDTLAPEKACLASQACDRAASTCLTGQQEKNAEKICSSLSV